MTDLFSAPATATGLDLKALLGALLLIHVHDIEQGINTSFGSTDAVRADVTALDGPQAGETFDDTLIFPRVLQSQLKSKIGERVLGRLGQGQAKPGQSAPWVLNAATQADADLATKWLTRVAAPAAAAAPTAQTSPAADDTPPWAR
jgi:hypothetical protein